MDEKFEQMQKMMTDLIGIVGKTNSMMAEMKADIAGLKAKISELTTVVNDVKATVERIEGTQLRHEKRLNGHTSRIALIEEELNISRQ